jgi:hypothetical protein
MTTRKALPSVNVFASGHDFCQITDSMQRLRTKKKDFTNKRFRRSQGRSEIMGGKRNKCACACAWAWCMEPDAPIDNTTRRVPLTRDSETRRWDLLWRSWVIFFFLATSNKTAARGLYSHALGTKEKNEKMVLLLLPLWCGLFGFS